MIRGLFLGLLGALAGAAACSSAGGSDGSGGFSGSGGSGGSGTGGASGGGTGGTLASGGASGSGGSLSVGGASSGGASGSGGSGASGDACAETTAEAEVIPLPADIIWAVDQSGSMNQETAYVQTKINEFTNAIAASNVDYRVVMVASPTGGNAVCVPPPLSGGSCGDGPRFKLIDHHVESNDALQIIVSEYPNYSSFLRPNALKHFVVITDDNSDMSAANFTAALGGFQPPGMFSKWKFHAVYSYGSVPVVGCLGAFGTGALVGTVYAQLVQQTGGVQDQICNGTWQPLFTEVTKQIIDGAKVSCTYTVPSDPNLDPTKVNVDYFQSGAPPGQAILRATDASQCGGPGTAAWYFDDNANPTQIFLCPSICSVIQGNVNAKVQVRFGCEDSIFVPA